MKDKKEVFGQGSFASPHARRLSAVARVCGDGAAAGYSNADVTTPAACRCDVGVAYVCCGHELSI